MKRIPDIEQKITQTLESLEGIQKAEPSPFFYTRLIGRLQKEQRTIWENISSYLSRPIVAIAGLCFIIVLNGFVLLRQDNSSKVSPVATQAEVFVTDNEYLIATSSSYDYENLDQQ
jgi:hypothetical protein